LRLRKLYDGSLLEDSAVTHVRAARVRIEAFAAGAVQADGQIVGHTPCEARIVRHAIDVIAPVP
jgi:diacylglycerol kinase family enzyme